MRVIAILIFLSFLLACKHTPQIAEGLPAGFEEFYQKFHEDSLYQIKHILFPLSGLPDNAYNKNMDPDTFRWQKNDWVMHHPYKEGETVFERQFNPVTNDLVEEVFRSKDQGFAMVRRFARSGGEWHLIYYAGMNPVKPEGNK